MNRNCGKANVDRLAAELLDAVKAMPDGSFEGKAGDDPNGFVFVHYGTEAETDQ